MQPRLFIFINHNAFMNLRQINAVRLNFNYILIYI